VGTRTGLGGTGRVSPVSKTNEQYEHFSRRRSWSKNEEHSPPSPHSGRNKEHIYCELSVEELHCKRLEGMGKKIRPNGEREAR
jgi:hypothetical protein